MTIDFHARSNQIYVKTSIDLISNVITILNEWEVTSIIIVVYVHESM